MTNQEAIEWFSIKLGVNKAMGYTGEQCESAKLAITALEKQIQGLPTELSEKSKEFVCPSCTRIIRYLDDKTKHKYCLNCGKALKWIETVSS